jgi:hypothetical protein
MPNSGPIVQLFGQYPNVRSISCTSSSEPEDSKESSQMISLAISIKLCGELRLSKLPSYTYRYPTF